MKIKDLLALFSKLDPELPVSFWIDDGCCGDFEELSDPEVCEYLDSKDKNEHFVSLRFPALWFNDTCITSGTAKRNAEEHKKRAYGAKWKPGMPNKAMKDKS